MKYDVNLNKLKFEFETYEDLLKANGTHEIMITLIDK